VTLRLQKLHGLGNDFLVVLLEGSDAAALEAGEGASEAAWAARAGALCDRHRGVGADGLIVATRRPDAAGGRCRMHLWNADGRRAELSGNGLRCLVRAVCAAGWVPASGEIDTDAGPVPFEVLERSDERPWSIRVAMGRVVVAEEDRLVSAGRRSWRARAVDVGNPHLVLLEPDPGVLSRLPLEELAAPLGGGREGVRNLEWITPVGAGLRLRVIERGVGLTEACGSGTVAAAAAARAWGLAGASVEVENPGGRLRVEVVTVGDREVTFLIGPAASIATLEVGPGDEPWRPLPSPPSVGEGAPSGVLSPGPRSDAVGSFSLGHLAGPLRGSA